MAGDDWFRNTDWNRDIERAFFAKLGRASAGNKAQYLRIQAGTLPNTHPETALHLLDQCFTLGDISQLAAAHVDRATALLALGNAEDAIAAYEAALSTEERHPNVRTRAHLDLPFLIAVRQHKTHYERALRILEQNGL